MQRRTFMQGAAALAALPTATAGAQARHITTIIGYPAGSAVDIAGRFVTQALPPLLGRQVIVDNRSGAGGQLAFSALKRGPADGSLLAFVPSNLLAIFPIIYDNLPYEPADVVPVATACTFDFALAVAADHPARTLDEFIAWCKANPQKASLGNPGMGTPHHFFGWILGRDAGVEIEPVAYRNTPQMVQEVAAGQVAAAIAALPLFTELVRAGKLRLLATTGPTRSTVFPEVPTFTEAGYPAVQSVEWFGFFAPAGTPQATIDQYLGAIRQVVAQDRTQQQFQAMGFNAVAHDGAWIDQRIQADLKRWGEVVRETGFKVDS